MTGDRDRRLRRLRRFLAAATISFSFLAVGASPAFAIDFTVDISASPDQVTTGDPVTMTLTVANGGPGSGGITATVAIPDELTVSNLPAECAESATGLDCSYGVVGAGNFVTRNYTVSATASGNFTQTATVFGDDVPGNNTDSQDTLHLSSDLALTIDDSADPVAVGADYQYDIDYENNGTGAPNPVIDIDFPAAVQVTDYPTADCIEGAGDLICTGPEIGPGGGGTFTIDVQATVGGTHAVTAAFENSEPPVLSGNNEDTETTTATTSVTHLLTVSTAGAGVGSVTSTPAGIACPPDCTEIFPEGTGVVLTAQATTGSSFGSWAGACAASTTRFCGITMDTPKSTTATFVPGAGPPNAEFTAPAKAVAGSPVRLNASASVGATLFKWDFNNDGNYDATTLPSQPFASLQVQKQGERVVAMTAIGPDFLTDTDYQTIDFSPGPKLPPKTPDIFTAGGKIATISATTSPTLGICDPSTTLAFGVVEARGCMTPVLNPEAIPEAERPVAFQYLSYDVLYQSLQQGGGGACRNNGQLCADAIARNMMNIMVAKRPISVNGMTITPIGGAAIVLFPGARRIVSSNAKLTFNGDLGVVPVPRPPGDTLVGPLNLDVTGKTVSLTTQRSELRLFSFDAKQLDPIAGFPIDGKLDLSFVKENGRYFSDLTLRVQLPAVFKTFGDGPQPSGQVTVEADNANGTVLSKLILNVPEAFLGPVRLAKVSFTYLHHGEPSQGCPRKWWKATAQIFLIPSDPDAKASGISLAPPPTRNGVAFCAGSFHSAGAQIIFGSAAPQIFPGVFLNSIQFDMQLQDPLLFSGGATITAAKLVNVDGGLLAAFATPSHPYTIRAEDGNNTMSALAGRRLTQTTFAVGGNVGVKVPEAGAVGFGNGYVMYSHPGYLTAGGRARIQTFLFTIIAQASLELNTETERFNISAGGDVCIAGGFSIAGYSGCVGGLGLVSSKGVVACLYIPRNVFEPGLGYKWNGGFEAFLGTAGDGCKPSHFTEMNVQGSRRDAQAAARRGAPAARAAGPQAAASANLSFRVKKGDKNKNIKLVGAGGAPAVTVRAPNGETITSTANVLQHGPKLSVLQLEQTDQTFIGVNKPVPGTYIITPQAGSPAITRMEQTNFTDGRITASVKARGRKRVLRYSVRAEPGQTVRFYEDGKAVHRLLKTVKRGSGTVTFTPAVGPGGKRRIIAEIEVDGLPAGEQTVATFKATTPKAGPVRRVRSRRRAKGRLAVTWRRARNATRYKVVASLANGVQRTAFLPAKRRRTVLRGVPATLGGTVRVAAIGPLGDWGKPGKDRFRATKRVKDRLLPFSELRRHRNN